ncbi:ASCH domain-containing protein [Pasteurellaceae bacterium HPA106]|uniref:N(4)-acetylcytidine aminohydrolase n=1 Tax=Spirabiliibacterium pneumoniae TaxID=221400 RepID=UPI001AAD5B80|nr:N(4)-acetylcytidine aminohydrolase [Spirabiliibacterium pneumoniae]MBE2896058.1 ASCH domain-containing protein [Spirabiliibacterium pneumoniae]
MAFDASKITFFERFERDIVAGRKTITIRNRDEKDYLPNTVVAVSTYEDDRHFANIRILSVTPITFDELNAEHAAQENMTLEQLKAVISEIYPNETALYVLKFEVVA